MDFTKDLSCQNYIFIWETWFLNYPVTAGDLESFFFSSCSLSRPWNFSLEIMKLPVKLENWKNKLMATMYVS